MNGDTSIISRRLIIFGDDCLISWGGLITDTDFHKIVGENDRVWNDDRQVTIGNHCWIGANSTILKGVYISDDTVVGAGSVITGRWDKTNVIIVSDRILKENVKWEY